MKKFFAFVFCIFATVSAIAMDNDNLRPRTVKEIREAHQELSNKKQRPKYYSLPFKAMQYLQDKGVVDKAKAILAKAKNHGKKLTATAVVLAYLLSDKIIPVTCIDLQTNIFAPSCVVTTTPIGGGMCFPLAYLICTNIKWLGAVGAGYTTYMMTNMMTKKKNKKNK